MAILEVKDISKIYNTHKKNTLVAVDKVSFFVDSGEIVGFIGANGAGKSTTIKMITGLATPNSGSVTINGFDVAKNHKLALKNVGAIIENPDMYLEWSALENMQYFASISDIDLPNDLGVLTKKEAIGQRIDELLKLVGLFDRRKDRIVKFSMGMKQRLGIAQALLSRPKLLILDEPNNGLDPNGIVEMRKIITYFARELHMAVLVSSHQLAEMQLMCDRYIIINKGKIVATPTNEEINANNEGKTLIIATDNIVGAKEILKAKFEIEATLGEGVVEFITNIDTGEITKELVLNNINICGIKQKEIKLEDIFINLTNKEDK